MDRRKFMQGSLAGVACLASLEPVYAANRKAVTSGGGPAADSAVKGNEIEDPGNSKVFERSASTLFPTEVPQNEWVRFRAEGFSEPVCGAVYRLDHPEWLSQRTERPNGMPIGGIDTGCIDLEKNGTFGFTTIFNSHVPRRGPLNLPYLGVSVGGRTCILADMDARHVSSIGWQTVYYLAPHKEQHGQITDWSPEDYFLNRDWQVRGVDQIHYWGHYPVADLEYELPQIAADNGASGQGKGGDGTIPAPLSVSLRAWSPFIPGDVVTSQMPGAVFEVHLRNTSDAAQRGTLAFSFPGPSLEESEGATAFPRRVVQGKFSGISVSNGKGIGYAIGAVDEVVRTGGELGINGEAWAHIGQTLPTVIEGQPGASVAVDFSLNALEQKTIRFVLSWYSPMWKGGGTLTSGGRTYVHMYTTHYQSALHVAGVLAEQHESLLKRVLAWQQVVYTAEEIPVWLRESLVNILHLMTENALWAVAKPPIGAWCRTEDGLLGMIGDPRDCPLMEGIDEAFYGNIPLVYFFPEMALSTLRGWKAYQNPDGSLPVAFSRTPTIELALDYCNQYQSTTVGVVYLDLVDRYWQCTGNDEVLREFYPSVKKSVIFTMNLNTGPDHVISAPTGDMNHGDGFISVSSPGEGLAFGGEWNQIFGMNTHLGGLHLAQLRMAQRMAEKMGDQEFSARCLDWIRAGTDSMENKMWAGSYYLNYWEPETGKRSNLIYAYQMAGEWIARYHGLPGVFRPDRVQTALETIQRINGSLSPFGAVMFADPGGTSTGDQSFSQNRSAAYGGEGMFVSETFILGATYMCMGQGSLGLNIVRKVWEDIVCKQGYTWQQPNLIRGDTGEPIFGWDFYQNMGIWMLPAALARQTLAESNKLGTLVARVLAAGAATAECIPRDQPRSTISTFG
jgi:uncharacterized protein (DUF608 family)